MATKSTKKSAKTAADPAGDAKAFANDALNKGAEMMTQMPGMMNGFTEGAMKAMTESAAVSTETMKAVGERNAEFFTRTWEEGVEASQAMMGAKDPKTAIEMQANFAKSMFEAYTSEMKVQGELYAEAFRTAFKPFQTEATRAVNKFQVVR